MFRRYFADALASGGGVLRDDVEVREMAGRQVRHVVYEIRRR